SNALPRMDLGPFEICRAAIGNTELDNVPVCAQNAIGFESPDDIRIEGRKLTFTLVSLSKGRDVNSVGRYDPKNACSTQVSFEFKRLESEQTVASPLPDRFAP